MNDLFEPVWGNHIEREKRNRILLTLWAYAYEIKNKPMVSDRLFDCLATYIDPAIETGRLDEWWRENFNPATGMWIHNHPELHLVEVMYVSNNN